MKNNIQLLLLCLLLNLNAFGQWVNEYVDNGEDTPYNICYNEDENNLFDTFYAKLENVNGKISFYIQSSDFRPGYEFAMIYFTVNGVLKTHTVQGRLSDDGELIFISDNLINSKLLYDFKASSEMRIDLFFEGFGHIITRFNMTGSTAAYNFIRQKV